MKRWTMLLVVCGVALLGSPAWAQDIFDTETPKEEHPYTDCTGKPLGDCFTCCATHSAEAKNACIQGGLSKEFCEEQGQRVYKDCITRACGVKSAQLTSEQVSEGLATFLQRLREEAAQQENSGELNPQ